MSNPTVQTMAEASSKMILRLEGYNTGHPGSIATTGNSPASQWDRVQRLMRRDRGHQQRP